MFTAGQANRARRVSKACGDSPRWAHPAGTTLWSAPAERSGDGALALGDWLARLRADPKRGRASLAPALHKAMAPGAVVPARCARAVWLTLRTGIISLRA